MCSSRTLLVALRRSMRSTSCCPVVSLRAYSYVSRIPRTRQERRVPKSLAYATHATSSASRTVPRSNWRTSHGVEDEGRTMRITWSNGETAAYSAVWLRHNCQCPSCLSTSGQKKLDPTILDPRTTVNTPRDLPGAALKIARERECVCV